MAENVFFWTFSIPLSILNNTFWIGKLLQFSTALMYPNLIITLLKLMTTMRKSVNFSNHSYPN